ncbi:MAG: hypothetical protein ABEJ28_02710 [Salinigranum sp.]
MIDVPVDAWYAWIGLSLASVVVFGAAGALPTSPPPDAAAVAGTVDRVAGDTHPAVAEYPLDASEIRVTPNRVGLRNDAGTASAEFAFGPVTPVADGSALQEVVYGASPADAFDTQRAFEQAVVDARSRAHDWHPVGRTLVVRRITWRGHDVTLVDA